MSPSLRTITGEVSAELEEKKSRFLGFVLPYAQFNDRLTVLRSEHPKANHHVTAFRLMRPDGRIEEGARDDGEPSGTSGMPILRLLIGERLIDVGVIVVRYFGGTKLGTGGLARAYPGVVKAALAEAQAIPGDPKLSVSQTTRMAQRRGHGCRTGADCLRAACAPVSLALQHWSRRFLLLQSWRRPSLVAPSPCLTDDLLKMAQ